MRPTRVPNRKFPRASLGVGGFVNERHMKVILPTVDFLSDSARYDSLDVDSLNFDSLSVWTSKYPPIARFFPILILLLLIGLLAACGPSDSGTSNADLNAATQRIALDYQASNDLAGARSALAALDVPNANQLLILVAETAISASDFINGDPLVRLALALGLTSSSVERYAQSRGLMPQQSQTASQSAVAVQPAAQQSTGQTAEQPTATPIPAEPTPTPEAATATPETVTATPEAATATPEAATATPEPATATPVTDPEVRTDSAMNVRGGPGTDYAVVGALNAGDVARITGKNAAGDWWQISLAGGAAGWVYGPLVTTSGDTGGIAIAQAPPIPPTAIPVVSAPAPEPTAAPAPAPSGVDFRLVERRLWTVEETGGSRSGDSINCQGGLGLLRVIILDINGNPLNGVTVQGIGRSRIGDPLALIVSGHKGPGIAEYDMNTSGDDITILRDVDGREVKSDISYNNTGIRGNLAFPDLIQAGYCTNDAQCAQIKNNDPFACQGHFSWTLKFQRTY